MLGWFVLTLLWIVALVVLFTSDLDREHPGLERSGRAQIVFDWSRDACEQDDIPDLPVRAFRNAAGDIVLIQSHFVNRREVGPSLDRVQHRCDVLLRSQGNPDPAQFDDQEWIASTWTDDGNTVFALLHNEYQGQLHPGRCPSGEYPKCWYNAITSAVSRDGGRTFAHTLPPPRHLVASVPYPYVPDGGTFGLFTPSNMIRRDDGYVYSLIAAISPHGAQQPGTCVMRTRTPGDPASWRAWDGRSYSVAFIDPYAAAGADPADHVCQPVAREQIMDMNASVTYNSFFDKYLLVDWSVQFDAERGREVWGVYYSLSDDLVNWSMRRLLFEAELRQSFKCGDRNPIQYPSLLDPDSRSRNFETSDRQAFIYYTQHHYQNCQPTLDRDLMRIPIEFSR